MTFEPETLESWSKAQ